MPGGARLRDHLRSNVVGYMALFIALSAGAYAAGLPRNSVKSKQIKDGQVRLQDLAAASVDGSKVVDDSLTGADIQEATLDGVSGTPDTATQILGKLLNVDGPGSGLDADLLDGSSASSFVQAGAVAGGDLAGTYPNPTVAAGAIGPDELAVVPGARVWNVENDGCTAGQTIFNNTQAALQFVTEAFDNGGLHVAGCAAATNTRLTAPRAGLYQVSAGILWPTSGTGKRSLFIRANDNETLAQDENDAAASGATLQAISTLTRLSQGGFVEARVLQTSGGDLVVDPASGGEERTYLAMAWLGP